VHTALRVLEWIRAFRVESAGDRFEKKNSEIKLAPTFRRD